VLLHIPHSSLVIPNAVRAAIRIGDAELKNELLRMTDWYSDILFDLAGAQRLVFPYSRLCCDVERFPDDSAEPNSVHGMGAIYERTSYGNPLREPMTAEARESYLERYYYPHHRELERMTEQMLKIRKRCLIVDCHSFPSVPLPCDLNKSPERRSDICIGTAGIQTPMPLVRQLVDACEVAGLAVSIDDPYSGAMIPQQRILDRRVEALMIEVRRGLYSDEGTGEKLVSFASTGELVRGLLQICQDFEMQS